MSPAAIEEYWQHRVRVLTENEPRLSARAMAGRLEQEAAKLNRSDSPSERWIRKEQVEFRSRQAAERAPYRQFAWPGSMDTGDLPWEASASALELLRLFRPYETGQRPTIALARWFWRITQAAPDAPVVMRRALAGRLTAAELIGDTRQPPAMEPCLVYRTWTPDGGLAEGEARQRGQVPSPIPDLEGRALSGPEVDDLLVALVGPETAEDVGRLRETMERIEAQRQSQKGESK